MSTLRARLSRLPAPLKRPLQDAVYPKPLAEGDAAPEWHLQDHADQWHRHGKGWTLLVFYVGDEDPASEAYLRTVEGAREQLVALGVKVLGVNPAEAPSHRALATRAGLGFPLLTDRGGSVARLFRAGVQVPGGFWPVATVVLVNPDRKIRLVNRGTPSVEAIVRSVQALQQVARGGM